MSAQGLDLTVEGIGCEEQQRINVTQRSRSLGISHVVAENFRNINGLSADWSSDINFLWGANGAGKTNILDLLHFALTLRPSRNRNMRKDIHWDAESALVRLGICHGDEVSGVGVQLTLNEERPLECRLNGEKLTKSSELALAYPSMFVDPSCMELVDASPSVRRKFIDWGVFHVKHDYASLVQRWSHCLRQRNILLRQIHATENQVARDKLTEELVYWTQLFVSLSEEIDKARQEYLDRFLECWDNSGCKLDFDGWRPSFRYYRGWAQDESLASRLFPLDPGELDTAQSTKAGPQRADLKMYVNNASEDTAARLARDFCSRGQKKLLSSTLRLRQCTHFNSETGRPLVLFVDDLFSELDAGNKDILLNAILDIEGQKFISAVEASDAKIISGHLAKYNDLQVDVAMFHVKHGHCVRE